MKLAGSSPRVTTSVRQLCTAKRRVRDVAEHARERSRGHRGVRSQGRQNTAQAVAIVGVRILGEFPGPGMEAAAVRGHGQNSAPGPELVQRLKERIAQRLPPKARLPGRPAGNRDS